MKIDATTHKAFSATMHASFELEIAATHARKNENMTSTISSFYVNNMRSNTKRQLQSIANDKTYMQICIGCFRNVHVPHLKKNLGSLFERIRDSNNINLKHGMKKMNNKNKVS